MWNDELGMLNEDEMLNVEWQMNPHEEMRVGDGNHGRVKNEV